MYRADGKGDCQVMDMYLIVNAYLGLVLLPT